MPTLKCLEIKIDDITKFFKTLPRLNGKDLDARNLDRILPFLVYDKWVEGEVTMVRVFYQWGYLI